MRERPLSHHLPFYRKLLLINSLTVMLLLAWPLKNYVLFGFLGYSSWQGYNLSQGLPVEMRSVSSVFSIPPPEETPAPYQKIPVLTEDHKSDGSPNWNYYPVIAVSRELGEQAIYTIHNHPVLLFQKAIRNYIHGCSLPSGRNPYEGSIDLRVIGSPIRFYWARAYEIIVFQYIENDTRQVPLNGFHFFFPIVVVLSTWRLFRRWNTDSTSTGTVALTWFTLIWVLCMVVFIDGMEGNRMRFPTEPFFWVLVAWSLPWSKLNRSDLISSERNSLA
jgi:hypothetical protein